MRSPAQMRLRITRQLWETIDGIQFSDFRTGYVYEVGTTVANYLLASGAAEPVDDDEPHIVLPPEKQLFHPGFAIVANPHLSKAASSSYEPLAEAADRPPRQRKPSTTRGRARTQLKEAESDVAVRVAALAAEVDRIKRDLGDLDRAARRGPSNGRPSLL